MSLSEDRCDSKVPVITCILSAAAHPYARKVNCGENVRFFKLAAIPAALVIYQLLLMGQLFPISLNSNGQFGQDPAYQYLFAGVDILLGNSPGHTDHPGTPLQILIAAIIPFAWALSRLVGATQLSTLNSVLTDPELYLASTSLVLLLATACASYYLGHRVLQSTNRYLLALACQTTPLIFSVVTPHVIYPTPEAALFLVSTLLMGAIAPFVFVNDQPLSKSNYRQSILIGGLCGVGFAIKVTFAPMLAVLLILGKFRLICVAAISMVVAWALGVLPIVKKIPQMFTWFYQVMSHTGAHGQGSTGIFNVAEFKLHLLWLLAVFPLFFYVFAAILIALLILSFTKIQARASNLPILTSFRVPGVLLLIALSQTLMVAKHVGASYMIPALPLALMAASWLLHSESGLRLKALTTNFFSAAWLILLCTLMVYSTTKAYSVVRLNHERGEQSYRAIHAELTKFNDPLLIGTFNCNFKECALWFGMLLVPIMELRMDKITPDFLHFDVFNKRLHLPGKGVVEPNEAISYIDSLLAQGRTILLISPPYPQLAQFKLTPILDTPIQNLYRVTGMTQLTP